MRLSARARGFESHTLRLEQKPQIKDFPVKSLVCGFLVGIAAQSRNQLGWWSRHIGEKNRAVYNAVEGNTTFLSCYSFAPGAHCGRVKALDRTPSSPPSAAYKKGCCRQRLLNKEKSFLHSPNIILCQPIHLSIS